MHTKKLQVKYWRKEVWWIDESQPGSPTVANSHPVGADLDISPEDIVWCISSGAKEVEVEVETVYVGAHEYELRPVVRDGYIVRVKNNEVVVLDETKEICSECEGTGGYIHPDGQSAHECKKCKGSGTNQQPDTQNKNEKAKEFLTKNGLPDDYGPEYSVDTEDKELEDVAKEYQRTHASIWDVKLVHVIQILEAGTNYQKEKSVADVIGFADWLPRNAQPRAINRNWILNSDGKEYTTRQLYELYELSNTGKQNSHDKTK